MKNLPLAEFADPTQDELGQIHEPDTDLLSGWQKSDPVNAKWFGNELMAIPHVYLPMRCVICNQPVEPSSYQMRALIYFNRWLVFLLGGLLGYLIFLLIGKECRVSYGYCKNHCDSRRAHLIGCFSGLFIGFSLALYAAIRVQRVDLLCGSGLVIFLIALLNLFGVHSIRVSSYRDGSFRLTGFGQAFQQGNPIRNSSLLGSTFLR